MSDVYDQVKSIIVDVLKVDENEIEMDTRFIEDLKARFDGSIFPD